VHAHSPDGPTRAAGLSRLAAFLPQAGRGYDARRNVDFGPFDRSNVSMLSAWIRHRLVREDDCDPLSLGLLHDGVRAAAGVTSTHRRSPLPAGRLPTSFSRGAVSDALGRIYDALGCPTTLFVADAGADDLVDWARSAGVEEIVALYAPVGPTSEWLSRVRGAIACAGVRLITVRREWDTVLWPHPTMGFFRFRERVPAAFRNLGIG
jgi:deoxyribodipyrimidine photo-lyase